MKLGSVPVGPAQPGGMGASLGQSGLSTGCWQGGRAAWEEPSLLPGRARGLQAGWPWSQGARARWDTPHGTARWHSGELAPRF